MRTLLRILLATSLWTFTLGAATHAQEIPEVPFSRGPNLTGWFQVNSPRQIQFSKYTRQDFERIKSLGMDVIRLPINLHFMTNGEPDYTLDPLFLEFLDQAVDWAEELEIHLILDNHTFNVEEDTDPQIGGVLEKVWSQMAAHYKDRSAYLYYEVLNEPHGISDALWNQIQQGVVEAIRQEDTTHWIVVGGAGWNSYNNLAFMPEYADEKLIYTFHFYDPFLFTHQGATWTNPSMGSLAGVPFPYQPDRMPGLPAELAGTWIQFAYNSYPTEGNADRVKALLDIAINFRESRKVPVYCGEFGVFIPNSRDDDRVAWYEWVRSYLEEHGIPWTSWDYHGGFGLFEPGGNDLFDHDLNVPLLMALGLNVPEQSEYLIRPDSMGYPIYRDFIEAFHFESSYSDGILDYYSTQMPKSGKYCIRWSGADQYRSIGFDIKPNKDLSQLRASGYALDFMVRGDQPGTQLDIRFMDTDTDVPEDRPWRMRITLDESRVSWDGRWHHVHIPLTAFEEHGAWENGNWYNPLGLFDWTAVDRLEIVTEHHPLNSASVWIDNLILTDQDTARANDTLSVVSLAPDSLQATLSVYPNPAKDILYLKNVSPIALHWEIRDLHGRIWRAGQALRENKLSITGLPTGVYVLQVRDGAGDSYQVKVLKE